jgi:hypothetical protein
MAADFLRELSRPKIKKKRRRFSHKGAETRRRREEDPQITQIFLRELPCFALTSYAG